MLPPVMDLFDGNRPSKASWLGWEKWWWALLDCETVRIFAYSVRASGQTKGLERS